MKIIGICGSPRAGGNSEWMLKEAAKGAREAGADVELFLMSEKDCKLCDGCKLCDEGKECPIKDDIAMIIPKILECDGIIFASPTWMDCVPALMKNFFDRLDAIFKKLEGKKVVFLTGGSADEGSWKWSIHFVKNFCDITKMHYLDQVTAQHSNIGDAEKVEGLAERCAELGRELVKP